MTGEDYAQSKPAGGIVVGTVFFVFELIGTVAFAVSGALEAIHKKMDIFGVMILGWITAVGGGVIRDTVIGRTPPAAFETPTCALIALGTAAVTFAVYYRMVHRHKTVRHPARMNFMLFAADSAGLAVFTVLGIEATLRFAPESNSAVLLFVGLITGVGGGILRDVLSQSIPYVFRKHIYALASILGAAVMLLLIPHVSMELSAIGGAAVVMTIRILAFTYKWDLPRIRFPES